MVINKIKMLPTPVKVIFLIGLLVGASLSGWVAWVLVIDPFLLPPSKKTEEIEVVLLTDVKSMLSSGDLINPDNNESVGKVELVELYSTEKFAIFKNLTIESQEINILLSEDYGNREVNYSKALSLVNLSTFTPNFNISLPTDLSLADYGSILITNSVNLNTLAVYDFNTTTTMNETVITTTSITTDTPINTTTNSVILISIKQGSFVRVDNFHYGSGTATLAISSSGEYEIIFQEVAIAKGPSLFVYLSKKSTFSGSSDSPGEYVDLGPLPANEGTYSITIPDTVQNVEDYQSVLIWCAPFSVVFTYASLS